jgi:hypothetical protein
LIGSSRIDRGDHFQQIATAADDGRDRDGAIEGREHAAPLLRQTEQIHVGELPVADAAAVEEAFA